MEVAMSEQDIQVKQEPKSIRFMLAGKPIKVRIEGDLELVTKSNEEIIGQLAKIPGRLAYWGAKKAMVASELDKVKAGQEGWFASKYFTTRDAMDGKPTEAAIANKILLDFGKQSLEMRTDIRELTETQAIISSILKAYEQQVWTLRAIVSMRTAELTSYGHSEDLSEIGGKSYD